MNNVETLSVIPYIMRNVADSFASFGTSGSKGTKVFALGGKINNVGLVEVPMGTTLRELIYDIGGGIPNGRKFKAIQTGGPSGGCLTEKDLDTEIDFDTLRERGSMMGSGGAIVMDEDNCMVDVAKFYMEFICDESCGKCSHCRIGTKRMLEILEKICEGKSKYTFIEIMGCPGGCINGGGQPLVHECFLPNENADIIDTYKEKRAAALYGEDERQTLRQSHNNPQIKKLYSSFLGEPNSHKAHELLHTTYAAREPFPHVHNE